jgi:hypothetical protein
MVGGGSAELGGAGQPNHRRLFCPHRVRYILLRHPPSICHDIKLQGSHQNVDIGPLGWLTSLFRTPAFLGPEGCHGRQDALLRAASLRRARRMRILILEASSMKMHSQLALSFVVIVCGFVAARHLTPCICSFPLPLCARPYWA